MGTNIMPKGKTSIKVFKGKTAGTLHWLKKKNVKIALHIVLQRFMQNTKGNMQNTSMAGVPMNCINWLALGAVVYGAMDKRNALKVLGLKEQINADTLQPLINKRTKPKANSRRIRSIDQNLIRNICKQLGIKTKRGRKQ